MTRSKTAIIIGAGPAGLTAALELLRHTDIRPVVLEATEEIGGLSRTVKYKGNGMDIGGHRFFSKSDRVMRWWTELMPAGTLESCVRERPDEKVLLIRQRRSRIYALGRFFDYPITLTSATLKNLGWKRVCRIGVSYLQARLKERNPEKSLEDFFIHRFGRELYEVFFRSYTEKVWGTPCSSIPADWGVQRIRGLNLASALRSFVKPSEVRSTGRAPGSAIGAVAQKKTETSVIDSFLYPKLGPGQFWEHVAGEVQRRNGVILTGCRVVCIQSCVGRIQSVTVQRENGACEVVSGDYFISTMPIRELVAAMNPAVPTHVRTVSDGLEYRDFITVGILVDRMAMRDRDGGVLKDTWIYVQEPGVLLGRLQVFHNWSPYLLSDPGKVWLGLEYFCRAGDALWNMSDGALQQLAIRELAAIGVIHADAACDAHVVRVPKAYPAYTGTYSRFQEIRDWADSFTNLFLIGRNGMHKYNNQDHSMLAAMTVVDGLRAGYVDRAALWAINTEQTYHEAK